MYSAPAGNRVSLMRHNKSSMSLCVSLLKKFVWKIKYNRNTEIRLMHLKKRKWTDGCHLALDTWLPSDLFNSINLLPFPDKMCVNPQVTPGILVGYPRGSLLFVALGSREGIWSISKVPWLRKSHRVNNWTEACLLSAWVRHGCKGGLNVYIIVQSFSNEKKTSNLCFLR